MEKIKLMNLNICGNVSSLNKQQCEEIFGDLTIEISEDMKLEDLLIYIKAASSKREAREFINGNSVMINGAKETDCNKVISKKDAMFGMYSIVRRGKKNYFLVKHI